MVGVGASEACPTIPFGQTVLFGILRLEVPGGTPPQLVWGLTLLPDQRKQRAHAYGPWDWSAPGVHGPKVGSGVSSAPEKCSGPARRVARKLQPLPLSSRACLTSCPWAHSSQTPDGDITADWASSCLGWWWVLGGCGVSWTWVPVPHPLPRGASAFPSFRFLHV